MTKKKVRWIQVPRIWAGIVAGLVALGASIRVTAGYIELPERVEAGEVHDQTQDERFNAYLQAQERALIAQQAYQEALNDFALQNQQAQQQAPVRQQRQSYRHQSQPVPAVWVEWDAEGYPWCTDGVDYWEPYDDGSCE